ncbi:MAG: glycosyltransferase family 39 protein [Phycisphaerae bacterium]|nr:phospholipid carrier-dependent glycosyltransferase [Phycisphaerae bacterium]NUQ45274.1 glycosyltransferase family 39 protein [Phycisphaerae bacterium]
MSSTRKAWGVGVLLLLAAAPLIGARFWNLEADMPLSLTRSGMPYTDEGWYNSNAFNLVRFGRWHAPLGLNLGVNLPVYAAMQIVGLKLLGPSLGSARAVVVVCSLVLILAGHVWLRRDVSRRAAWLFTVLAGTNFFLFGYSRLALLEIPLALFIVLSFYAVLTPASRRPLLSAALSSLACAAALLTKSTAMPMLPAALFVLWRRDPDRRRAIACCALFLAIQAAVVSGYYVVAARIWPEDTRNFLIHNFASGGAWMAGFIPLPPSALPPESDADIAATHPPMAEDAEPPPASTSSPAVREHWLYVQLRSSYATLRVGVLSDPLLYGGAAVFGALALLLSRQLRRNLLVQSMLLWLTGYFVLIVIKHYWPFRYYVPVIVLVLVLTAAGWEELARRGHRALSALFALVLLAAVGGSLYRTWWYLSTPRFSWLEMARDVDRVIRSEAGDEATLLGNGATMVTMATGLHGIEDRRGLGTLERRVRHYRPKYYMVRGDLPADRVQPVLDVLYTMELMKRYDVFGNYLNREDVRLYRLIEKPEAWPDAPPR